jgi:IS1 family transposase
MTKEAHNTNLIECFNKTLRQRVSRLARATLSFSKIFVIHTGALK